ncbi:ADP-ribosylation factor-like protein 6 [Paramecium bursaria]
MRVKVLIVGLDNSGKTSIVNWLRQKGEQVAPTVGYNNEEIERHNLKFEFIDMSGQQQYRDMWEQFAQKIDGVIFVIDASDQLRYTIMAHEFRSLYEYIKQVPILVYANKSDAKDAKPANFFSEMLQLKQIKNQSICVESSVITGDGIDKGLQWLSSKIQEIKKK